MSSHLSIDYEKGKMQKKETIIRASTGWKPINFKELLDYRDLLYFLTLRGIKAKYAQSILGVGWAVFQPLISTLVFTIVFGNFAKISSDGIPYSLFSLIGLLAWNYFSGTLTDASNSLIMNTNLLTKVYFPRLVLPLSAAFSRLLDFIIGFIIVIVFLMWYQIAPGLSVLLLPLLIIELLLTSLGIGMILSAMSVQYRDVKHAMTFMVQLLIYAAPVVYSTKTVPERYQTYYALNPMVGVIEGFRSCLLDLPVPWFWIVEGMLVSLVIMITGLYYFKKMEHSFADIA